jgi:hypothetical protein
MTRDVVVVVLLLPSPVVALLSTMATAAAALARSKAWSKTGAIAIFFLPRPACVCESA